MGYPIQASHEPEVNQAIVMLKNHLGESEFEKLWARGEVTDLETELEKHLVPGVVN